MRLTTDYFVANPSADKREFTVLYIYGIWERIFVELDQKINANCTLSIVTIEML